MVDAWPINRVLAPLVTPQDRVAEGDTSEAGPSINHAKKATRWGAINRYVIPTETAQNTSPISAKCARQQPPPSQIGHPIESLWHSIASLHLQRHHTRCGPHSQVLHHAVSLPLPNTPRAARDLHTASPIMCTDITVQSSTHATSSSKMHVQE